MSFAALFGQFILGWLFADFLSGVFHWWEDRVVTEQMPMLGSWLISPNRLHHREPLAFVDGTTVWDRSLATFVFALSIGSLWLVAFGPSVFWFATVIGGMATTEVHRYTHQPRFAPRWLRVLQETGFVQSPKEHARHHRPPATKAYCALTDWVNPVVDELELWKRLESLFLWLGFNLSLGER